MGDEVDNGLLKKVKVTQEVLGSFIRRPPLTEKHLMKPPFRFIHDIVMAVIDNTGFLQGLFEGAELDASTITTRETKTAFMQKLVDCLKIATGEQLEVKISKVLAGQEPGRTNDLLICIGNAIAKGVSSDKAVEEVTGKAVAVAGSSKKKSSVAKMKESSPYSTNLKKQAKTVVSKEPTKKPATAAEQGGKPRSKPNSKTSPGSTTSKPTIARQGSMVLPSKGGASAQVSPRRGSKVESRKSSGAGILDESELSLLDSAAGGAGAGGDATGGAALLSTDSKDSRTVSKYGRNGRGTPQARGPVGGAEEEEDEEAEGADAAEKAEFMGELEFLLKKHGLADEEEAEEKPEEREEEEEEEPVHAGQQGPTARGGEEEEHEEQDRNNTDLMPAKRQNSRSSAHHAGRVVGSGDVGPLRKNSVTGGGRVPTAGASRSNKEASGGSKVEDVADDNDTLFGANDINDDDDDDNGDNQTSTFGAQMEPVPPTSALAAAALGTVSRRGSVTAEEPKPAAPRPHTSQMRGPRAGTARGIGVNAGVVSGGGGGGTGSVPRPPSARPAPPRPKTALFDKEQVSNFRPTTAKVANVLLDNDDQGEDDDDSNFIVTEVAPGKNGAVGNEESEDLGLGKNDGGSQDSGGNIDAVLDQRGLLVNQILDSQSKLEDGSKLTPGKKTDIERDSMAGDKDRMRLREITAGEVDKLKNLMQLMARNANPLGKLMDFIQEDVDAMSRDLSKWREEGRKLDAALEAAQEETEKSLEPLRRRMAELDEAIADRHDSIAATKMNIHRQEERIRKVLLGLDKVKPRSGGKEHVITSADLRGGVDDDDYLGGGGGGGDRVYFGGSGFASIASGNGGFGARSLSPV